MEAIKPQNEKVSYLICTNKLLNLHKAPFRLDSKSLSWGCFGFAAWPEIERSCHGFEESEHF